MKYLSIRVLNVSGPELEVRGFQDRGWLEKATGRKIDVVRR